MLANILRLREVRVDDVMVPRADIDAVEIDITLGDLLAEFRESGHSRMPVYRETLDDPVGMVHIKDLMGYVAARRRRHAGRDQEAPEAHPGDVDLDKVDLAQTLAETDLVRNIAVRAALDAGRRRCSPPCRRRRIQMALVIDEYGGTDGLVSLEDVVEIVVGDIEDEHDDDTGPMIVPDGDGSFLADARADLDEVAAAIGADLASGEEGEDVDTIGGLVFSLLGRIPVRGELIPVPGGFEFEILDADPRRIKRVRIHKQLPGAEPRRRPRRPRRACRRRLTAPGADLDLGGRVSCRFGTGIGRMQAIANAIIVLWGWRRVAVAVLAGAVSALALPPFDAFPVLWADAAGSGLADRRRDGAGRRRPRPRGCCRRPSSAGASASAISSPACGGSAPRFWSMPAGSPGCCRFAVLALPAGLALFWGFGAALARLFWPEGWPRILVFAVAMTLAEWLRGHVLTGFPVERPRLRADAVAADDAVGVARRPLGPDARGLRRLRRAGAPRRRRRTVPPRRPRLPRRGAVAPRRSMSASARSALAGAGDDTVAGVRLRIVQPAIDQDEKWQADNADAIFRRDLDLSRGADGNGPRRDHGPHLAGDGGALSC